MAKIKVKQITSDNQPSGKYIITNGSGGLIYGNSISSGVITGTTFPITPQTGDLFYRVDTDQLYHYDDSSTKWLTVNTSLLSCGRSNIQKNSTAYMYIGNATMSSTTGFVMKQNGTIISATVDNNNTMGTDRNIEIRVNNSTTNRIILTVTTGNSLAITTTSNLNFNQGDRIQVLGIANGGTNFSNVTMTIEVAWRP